MTSEHGRMPRGMTLVEMLLTVSILSFSVMALAGLQHHIYASNTQAAQRSLATGLAHEKMAALQMVLTADPSNIDFNDKDTLGPPSSGSTMELAGLTTRFERNWSVAPTGDGTLAVIQVTVTWRDNQGLNHALSLASMASLTRISHQGTR